MAQETRTGDSRSGMPLGISTVMTGTLSFGLRHFVAFYLFGLLVRLPTYLHSFLPRESLGLERGPNWPEELEFPEFLRNLTVPRPSWETDLAIPLIETVLWGHLLAVAVVMLQGDRRGNHWAVFSGLGEVARRAPTIFGVSVVIALVGPLFDYITGLAPWIALILLPLLLFAALVFCVAIPCAAGDSAGTIDCFDRSAQLTAGSRWRILAIFLLSILPVIGVVVVLALSLEHEFGVEKLDIAPLWGLLAGALLAVYFLPLMAVIHEALVALKEGPDVQSSAQVFD